MKVFPKIYQLPQKMQEFIKDKLTKIIKYFKIYKYIFKTKVIFFKNNFYTENVHCLSHLTGIAGIRCIKISHSIFTKASTHSPHLTNPIY